MLRHSVFALVLVGAAFAGGAAINGPGLTWLQRTVLGGPSIIVDAPPNASLAAAPRKPPKQFPTARSTPLVVDLPATPEPRKKAKPAEVAGGAEPLALPPESPSSPASALIPPAGLPAPDPIPAPKADPVARLASSESPSTSPLAPSAAPDWIEIRKRMRSLGIARYTLEAETEGRVKFSCIIPVDGLRAVGHRFEAEGDDEAQAAEAALRRIALWQATEGK